MAVAVSKTLSWLSKPGGRDTGVSIVANGCPGVWVQETGRNGHIGHQPPILGLQQHNLQVCARAPSWEKRG